MLNALESCHMWLLSVYSAPLKIIFPHFHHICRPGSKIGRGGWSLFWKWICNHCNQCNQVWWWWAKVANGMKTWRTDIRCWILIDLIERIEGEGESKLIWLLFCILVLLDLDFEVKKIVERKKSESEKNGCTWKVSGCTTGSLPSRLGPHFIR